MLFVKHKRGENKQNQRTIKINHQVPKGKSDDKHSRVKEGNAHNTKDLEGCNTKLTPLKRQET